MQGLLLTVQGLLLTVQGLLLTEAAARARATSQGPEGELKLTDFGLGVFFKPGERFRDLVSARLMVWFACDARSIAPGAIVCLPNRCGTHGVLPWRICLFSWRPRGIPFHLARSILHLPLGSPGIVPCLKLGSPLACSSAPTTTFKGLLKIGSSRI